MTLKEIAQSVLAEDAAVSPATAELSAGNIDLAAQDIDAICDALDADDFAVVEDYGTSDGARKGWLTRRRNSGLPLVSEETLSEFKNDSDTAAWHIEAEPDFIMSLSPIRLQKLPPVSEGKDNTSIVKGMRKLFGAFGEVRNADDNLRVVFNKRDAGKMTMESGVDMRRFSPQMKRLFETAVLTWREPPRKMENHTDHPDVIEYRNYVNKFVEPNGKPNFVRFTVRIHKGEKGRKGVHAATVSEVALFRSEKAIRTNLANKSRGTNRRFVDTILAKFLMKCNRGQKNNFMTKSKHSSRSFNPRAFARYLAQN